MQTQMLSARTFVVMGLLCGMAVVGSVILWMWPADGDSPPVRDATRALLRARKHLQSRDWHAAEAAVQDIPATDRCYPETLLILGESAAGREDWEKALGYYEQIPRTGGDTDVRARLASAEIEFHQGRLLSAYQHLRYGLTLDPDELYAKSQLSLLLDLCGRRHEASELLFDLVLQNAFSERHLLLLAEPAAVHEPAIEVRRTEPDDADPLVNLANGRYALWRDDRAGARRFLQAARQQAPDLVEAWLRLGELAILENDQAALAAWREETPGDVDWHPGIWLLRARWAESSGEVAGAVRSYWEALRREPNLQMACYRLGRLLPAVEPEIDPQPYLQRSLKLQELASLATILYSNPHHVDSLHTAALTCESLGRYWEAAGWARAALLRESHLPWARKLVERCQPRLSASRARNDPQFDPAQQVDLSHFPLPTGVPGTNSLPDKSASSAANTIRFDEDAAVLGIDFAYNHGPDPTTPSGRMFEFTGGGAAAVDFDLNGWSDLYWVQGSDWPPQPGQSGSLDRLYRNCRTGFTDVTSPARLHEDRFGQGVTVGDYDQDGFPDLYVANTHVNRLWRNLGDGTFADATESAQLTASQWTTSCLLADLNRDGLPDIVDVNYAQGDDVFTRICEQNGIARSCSPLAFPAANDQAFLNRGDGTFEEITQQIGFDIGEGRGLGIVAFRPTPEHRGLNLFVANDMTANFYFANRTESPQAFPRFDELGVISGLAFDANGAAQACMGIAAGDIDGNGLLDFCVTNFYAEANNLFLQQPGESFSDEAAAANLRDASYSMLGFGTQFLDADGDGWQDLIVANGHVDDFRHRGLPYRMRPQVFRNRGGGRFDELPAGRVGPYFESEWLGRGLARLDWNRDRREDIAISHLEDSAALLTNRTVNQHHAISLRLHGRAVDRDAIGAIVQVHRGSRLQTVQLTAGDGYESSNERRLVIGVGEAETISLLHVSWSDGDVSEFKDVAVDQDYVLVQGGQLLTLP